MSNIGDKCSKCGKIRGKYAQPWRTCRDCGKILCRTCGFYDNVEDTTAQCHKCWDKEYEESERVRKRTPVECNSCHEMKLPRYMDNMYVPSICKKCQNEEDKSKAKRDKLLAVDGVIVVEYGEHPKPKRDGGFGYSYYCDEPVSLGDIVRVPQTQLDRMVCGEVRSQLATVVSTYSTYNGNVDSVIEVVKRS